MQKLNTYMQLMRLDKPIGIFLLLWPTLIALWIAGEGKPNLNTVIIFIAGVILMRSAGCVVNDLADRNFDKAVSRTASRPLALGIVTTKEAISLFSVLLILAFLLVLKLNTFTIQLSLVGVILAVIYPLMKRWMHFPQWVLGAAFGWAVPMAYAAIKNAISIEAFLLYFATLCWTVAFDTEYAMVDREEDKQIGVKSFAIALGRWDRLVIFCLQGIALFTLCILGSRLGLGYSFYIGIFSAFILVLYQQFLIIDRKPENCFKAFLNNNLFGACLFMGLALDYWY
jgi:4-hydroxybenzoate polyprenyltransferase